MFLFVMLSATMAFAWENMDGKTWNELERTEKKFYLEGLVEGMNITLISMMNEFQPDANIVSVAEQLLEKGELIVTGDDYEEAINNFNEDFKDAPDKTIFDLMVEDELGFEP